MAIGVDVDLVSILRDRIDLKIAQVEARQADRGICLAARDPPIAFRAVLDGATLRDEGQVPGIAEGQIVIGELQAEARIPGTSRRYVVDVVAGFLDDFAFVVDFNFVSAPGIERALGDKQELVVVAAGDEVRAERFTLKDVDRLAVNAGLGYAHATRNVER